MKRKEVKQKALPTGWRKVRLGEVVEIIGGGTPKTEVSEYWDGSIPWLTPPDFVNSNRWVNNSKKSITKLGLNRSPTKLLQKGDLIFSARGTVGAVAQLERPMTFSQTSYGLRVKPEIVISDFLFYFLRHNRKKIQKLSYGATFDTVTTKTFNFIAIILPPLPEQKAIASLLETWDTAIEKTEALIAAKEKRFKWLLKTLISDQQTASKGWCETHLGDLFDIQTYSSKSSFIVSDGSRVVVDMGAISRQGDLIETKKTDIDRDLLSKLDLVMPKDDIGGGNIIGKVAILEKENKYVCGDHVYQLVNKTANNTHFLYFLINGFVINKQLRAKANGTSQLSLGKQDILKQKVWLPKLEHQHKIVTLLITAKRSINLLQQIAKNTAHKNAD